MTDDKKYPHFARIRDLQRKLMAEGTARMILAGKSAQREREARAFFRRAHACQAYLDVVRAK